MYLQVSTAFNPARMGYTKLIPTCRTVKSYTIVVAT